MNIKPTKVLRTEDVNREWFILDATNLVLGRLASQIAIFLRGKNKSLYTPHTDSGDYLIVVNFDQIILTGKKWENKVYYSHSNYPGGLKKRTASEIFKSNPGSLLKKAVKGMLPRNRLSNQQILRLFVYSGTDHPHKGQKPKDIKL